MSHPCLEDSVSNLWPKLSPPWKILHAELDHSARHREVSKTFPYAQKDRATPLPSTPQCNALVSQPTEQCFVDFVGLYWAYTLADKAMRSLRRSVLSAIAYISGWLGDVFSRKTCRRAFPRSRVSI